LDLACCEAPHHNRHPSAHDSPSTPSDARTDNWDFPALDLNRNGVPVFNETGVYSTDLLTREGQTIIENHDASSPLFLYMSYLAVHEPIQAPAEFVEMNAHLTDAVRDMVFLTEPALTELIFSC
jgi:hypothetical protein